MWGEGASDLWGRLERDEDEREAEFRERFERACGATPASTTTPANRRREASKRPDEKTRGPLRPAGPGLRQGRTPGDNS